MPDRPTPRELGYRMPAEWSPHAATWLSWPHKEASWPGKFEPIPRLFAEFVRTLARFEEVRINAGGPQVMAQAKALVGNVPGVTLYDIPTDDAWCRDHGPTFLVGPAGAPAAVVDWGYNAWGGKYPPYDQDDAVPRRIADVLGRRVFAPGIILEGGAIDVNGAGTVLTTEECLLNPNRNPELGREETEWYLREYLNVSTVLWLSRGIAGDDTDGHIDELARFVGPRTVVAALETDRADENYEPLRENYERLKTMRIQDGRMLEVVPLPMPEPMHHDGQRLPASYCNFYIANGQVIVPQFGDRTDAEALKILRPLFPDRDVVGMAARELAWGLGAYHCITQQEPKL